MDNTDSLLSSNCKHIHLSKKTPTTTDKESNIIYNLGEYDPVSKNIVLYNHKGFNIRDTLIHELAHTLDTNSRILSNSVGYKGACDFDSDNLKGNKIGYSSQDVIHPTDYSKRRYNEYLKDGKEIDLFAEDFAESVRLYFDKGKAGTEFRKFFKGRTAYLDKLFNSEII